MSTLLQIRNRIREEIHDEVKSAELTDLLRWTGAQITTQVNESANFIAQEFKHIMGTKSFSTVSGTNSYAFSESDDFLGYPGAIEAIWYSDGSNWYELKIQNYVRMRQYLIMNKDSSNGAPPIAWTLWNNTLYLHQTPNYSGTSNLEVYIYKKQDALVVTTNDATELSGEITLHPLIALHAALELAKRDKAIESFGALQAKYNREFQNQRRLRASAHAGPQFTMYHDF